MSSTDRTQAPVASNMDRELTNPLTIGGQVDQRGLLSTAEAIAASGGAEDNTRVTTGSIQSGGDSNYGDPKPGDAATQKFSNMFQTYLCCCFYNAEICSPEMKAAACVSISAAGASCSECLTRCCSGSCEKAASCAETCGEAICCPFRAAGACFEKTYKCISDCCSMC